MGEHVKASAIYAEAFRLEGEVKRLQEALAAANAELAIWRDEDAREAKYEHVSKRCTAAEESLAAARRECEEARKKYLREGFALAQAHVEVSEHDGWHRTAPFIEWREANAQLEAALAAPGDGEEGKR